MKILGHPVHMMLVHFPSALFPMELVCYAIYYYTGNSSFASAAFYAMVGGVGIGWLAVLFGVFDLTTIKSTNNTALTWALAHGSINTTILITYTVFAALLIKQYPLLPPATIVILTVKGLAVCLLLAGNYLGGTLVLKHKIGVAP